MKWAITIVVALPAPSFAFDWSPDDTRYLSDPSFHPLKGQIESHSTYSFSETNEDFTNTNGITTNHVYLKTSTYTEFLAYGVTDRLTFTGNADYIETHSKQTSLSNSVFFEGSSFGFSNPAFGIVYRAIEQGRFPVSVDLNPSYRPSTGDDRPQSFGTEIDINRVMKSATIQGVFGTTYVDSRTTQLSDGTSTSVSSYWSYLVGLRSQFRPTDRWGITADLLYSRSSDISFQQPNAAFSDTHDGTFWINTGVNYHFIPNRAVLGAEYLHYFIGDAHRSGSFNGVWTNQNEDVYALHLRLLF